MYDKLKQWFDILTATELRQNLLVILLVVLVIAISYANGLQGQFVYDDHILLSIPSIKSLSTIPKLFQESFWGPNNYPGHYRPINNMTLALNYSVNELRPFGYHAVNVFIHLINCFFIYWLCDYYSKKKLLSLFCVLLFATHPIHVEAVTAIYGRPETLASLFLFVAWACYLKSNKHNYFYIFSLISYIFSLLCKESGLVLFGILFLEQICTESTWREKIIPNKKLLGYILVTIPYFIVRLVVTKALGVGKLGTFFKDETFLTRFYTMSLGYLKYFEILLWPTNLSVDYDYSIIPKATSITPSVLLGLGLILGLIIFSFWQINRNPIITFSILFFFVTTSIVSNIIFPTGILIAERVIYLASLSVCLLVAALLYQLYSLGWSKTAILVFIILLSLASIRTHYRNLDFENNLTFFEAMLKSSPRHLKANLSLGEYYKKIDPVKAESFFKKAIEIAPTRAKNYTTLADLYFSQGEEEKVLPLVDKAISLAPDLDEAHKILARIYSKKGENKKAVESFLIAIKNSPPNAKLEQELAIALSKVDDIDGAIVHLKKAVELDPYFAEPLVNLSKIHRKAGRQDLAITLLNKALKLDPNNSDANNLFGADLLAKGEPCQAKKYLIKATIFDNQLAEAYSNLGVAYAQINRYDQAKQVFERALKINPDYSQAKNNLDLLNELGEAEAPPIDCPK